MDNEILFVERQKFNQWWAWAILILINTQTLFILFRQISRSQQSGDIPINYVRLFSSAGLPILLTVLFTSIRLDTQIKSDGLYVRFFPFHFSFRQYPWKNISKAFVRQYSPIGEYGGWGIRFGLFGKGKAFNVSGNKGLQLEFLDKRKLLIGTNKPNELEEALNKLGQLKQ